MVNLSRPRICTVAVLLSLAAGASAQGPFAVERELVPNWAGFPIGAADFDADGDLDLATALSGVLLNDGSARFTPLPTPSGPPGSQSVAIADLNGDGLPDALATTGTGLGAWFGVGGGAFVNLTPILPPLPPGQTASAVATGDVDGDGDQDVVIGLAGAPMLLWKNLGAANFVDASNLLPSTTLLPWKIALLDLDLDGDQDILLTNNSSLSGPADRITIENLGASFGPPVAIGGAISSHERFVTGDVNGDLLPDVAFYNAPLVNVAINTGSGFSVGTTVSLTVTAMLDTNLDGTDELVGTSALGLEVRPIGPSGTILPPVQVLGMFASGDQAVVGDFDGDGDRDLVVRTPQANRVVLTTSQGLVQIPGYLSTPYGALYGALRQFARDFDGDGDVDLIGGLASTTVVARNDGSGQLDWLVNPPPCTGPCPTYLSETILHPFNADGNQDLDLYVANGAPQFTPQGDRVLLNTGGAFTATILYALSGTTVQAVTSGDVDGDGDQDLVVARSSSTGLSLAAEVFLNSGSGTFAPPFPVPLLSSTVGLALADVDADGDLDLIEANYSWATTVSSALLLNAGNGSFVQVPFPGVASLYVATGDLDGDGDVDVLLDQGVLLNAGNGTFTAGTALSWGVSPQPRELADLDDDGDLDVFESGRVHINLGAATFAQPWFLGGGGAWSAIADFDRDGDQDVVTPMSSTKLFSGTARQLARGSPARPGRPASFDLRGPAFGTWTLFVSTGAAAIPLAPHGTVWIDPVAAWVIGTGGFDSNGQGSWAATLPPGPSLVGQTFWVQALVFGGLVPKLTGYEVVTVSAY
jgi:FG-GAP-like repeat